MPGAIECRGLTKRFGRLTAVRELDLSLDAGTVLGFVGPNGAGKSTTIRMMLGLCVPTAGSVRLWGADPLRESKVRARVGYSPGELRLDERLTVAATLTSWGKLRHSTDTRFRDELVERLGVQPDRQVRGLSTGNRRKVALVGALMSRPDLLVLDEPTNGLDPLVQEEFMTILGESAAAGTRTNGSSNVPANRRSPKSARCDLAVCRRSGQGAPYSRARFALACERSRRRRSARGTDRCAADCYPCRATPCKLPRFRRR